MYCIKELISEKISGEWGSEPDESSSVKVLRTTNFTNSGVINFEKVVQRNISKLVVDKKRLQLGDVIIEKSGGSPTQPVGRVVYFDKDVEEPILCNNFTTILRPNEKVFPKYFFYSLYANHLTGKTLKFQNKTTGIINLKLERYLDEKIPLPPLSEQKRIADILDKADSLRQKRKESIALLDELLKSVFIDMFGDPVRNEKGWEVRKAKDLFEIQLGKMLSAKNYTGKNLTPYLRNINVQWDAVDTRDIKMMDFDDREFQRYKLQKGDILVTEGGDVGRTAIYDSEVENCCYQNALHRLRKKVEIDSYYFLYFMMFAAERGMILKRTSTVTIAHFTAEKFKEFDVLYPDLKLQLIFGEKVATVKKTKLLMQGSDKELDNQFHALLQRAFRGA